MILKQKLELLAAYFQRTQQVGHTALVRQGFDDYPGDKLILSRTMNRGNRLRCLKSQIVTLNTLDRLNGHNWPMVIDNDVIIELFHKTLWELDELEEKLNKANVKIKQLEYGNFIENTSGRPGRDERRGIESRSHQMEQRRFP